MEITIRKADAADLDAVVRVYQHVHDAEEAGPAQVGWVRGVYPVRSTAEAALERGEHPAIVTRRPCLLIKRDRFQKGMCHVEPDKCRSCRSCLKVGCPAVSMEEGKAVIDRTQCVGCTVCAQVCPFGAIVKEEV